MEAKVINILSAKWREKLFSVPVIFQRKLRYALVSMKKSSKFQLIFYEFYFLNQKNFGIFLHLFLKWFLSVTCVLKTIIIYIFLNRNRQSVYLKSNKLVYLQWTIMYIVKKKMMLYLFFFLIFIRKSKPNNIQEYRSRSGPFSKPKRKKKVNVNRVIAT